MTEPIRVCIADDHAVVREGLSAFLTSQPDIALIGLAGSGEELVELVARSLPDVVVVDLLMPGMGGVAAIERVLEVSPTSRVIVLSSSSAQAHVIGAMRAGAKSYLLKDATANEIADAIRAAARGDTATAPSIGSAALRRLSEPAHAQPGGLAQLTSRELEVLRCIADGLPNALIAQRLSIGEGTVKTHVTNILAKLAVADRTQAAVIAWREGVVGPESHRPYGRK
jgi:NarL family two-component system response regulator LiaR